MVVQGDFSLRLINANTMKPMEEHCSSTGKTFVTLASTVDFWVELESLKGTQEGRRIFYQTFLSSPATTSRHKFKRRQRLDSFLTEKPDIFRFEKVSTQSYDSVAKETVTVRVFEATENGKKHLETITLHCCVIPPCQPKLPERATSLGTLLSTNLPAFANHARGSCLLKKQKDPVLTSMGRGDAVSMQPSLVR